MKKQLESVTREQMLSILSDDEAKRVGLAETVATLVAGDEYVDLNDLSKGVQRVGDTRPARDVLCRKSINEHTWQKLVANLNARNLMQQAPGIPSKRA